MLVTGKQKATRTKADEAQAETNEKTGTEKAQGSDQTAKDSKEAKGNATWNQIITAVDNPLRFFALALLIVEALIGVLSANEGAKEKIELLTYVGTGLFVFTISAVVVLIIFFPGNLVSKTVQEIIALKELAHRLKQNLEQKIEEVKEEQEVRESLKDKKVTNPTNKKDLPKTLRQKL